ncbi:lipopolysaccharide assembly protein LapA domain-containing protein [Pseudomonas sp. HY7a-MNA-CIBAN-0227]|uniref:lipopolysaccharide assembly protein LapA domain-containing protein n=1 Tax=Pseudomonas sp. HY7a-MNA-CIBAN-0227 TaxID=3140474 RepID=UPI0033292945
MRGVKRVAMVLTVLIVALVILAFVLENQQDVALAFLGWSTPQMPVSVFVTLALIVGMLLGPVLGLLVKRSGRRRQVSQER